METQAIEHWVSNDGIIPERLRRGENLKEPEGQHGQL
jgi:hypothetical protein